MRPLDSRGIPFAELSPEQQQARIKLLRRMAWAEFVIITGFSAFAACIVFAPDMSLSELFAAYPNIMSQLVSVCLLFGVATKTIVDLIADVLEMRTMQSKGYSVREKVHAVKAVISKKVIFSGMCFVVGMLLLLTYIRPLFQAALN